VLNSYGYFSFKAFSCFLEFSDFIGSLNRFAFPFIATADQLGALKHDAYP
jgi:hypothetical protein